MSWLMTGPYPEERPSAGSSSSSSSASRQRPHWEQPTTGLFTGLRLFNTLTQTKTDFVPASGRSVKWYICGPTVYDAAHMGHARAYITFDILRRVIEGYFGYEVTYQMNVTDIDDKIILRGRQNFLFDEYKAKTAAVDDALLATLDGVWGAYVLKLKGKYPEETADQLWARLGKLSEREIDERVKQDEKFRMNLEVATAMKAALEAARASVKSGHLFTLEEIAALLEASRDIVSPWLDRQFGATVTDHKIFRDLSSYWEGAFFRDMDRLGVQRPDVVTRVSEFVPACVEYTRRIIENGYAYEAEGSVYFDARRFDAQPQHFYAKLSPQSAFNVQLIEEGEGSISLALGGKRSPSDFALWKKSKEGEPVWDSPWSQGRPGWHIECSVMASHVFGDQLDIHSGGIDLAFPHHDNEIAQTEAHYGCAQWVNYFLHAGHLHINGLKMSKSLKNFISIDEALKKHTARQIRLMFLMHSWDSVLDYKEDTIKQAISLETTLKNFFSNVKAIMRDQNTGLAVSERSFADAERGLLRELAAHQARVHAALCDSVDTPSVLEELKELISKANVYINGTRAPNPAALHKLARYVTKLLQTFGVVETCTDIGFGASATASNGAPEAGDLEARVMPYLSALAEFRDGVRSLAREKRDPREILALTDSLRDHVLPELGVRLEDREGANALVKLEDHETLLRERQEKLDREAEKQQKKREAVAREEAKRQEKLLKGKVAPSELFRVDAYAGKFSRYDEKGVPTHDAEGAEVTKSARKKLEKEHERQVQLHQEYQEYLAQTGASSASS